MGWKGAVRSARAEIRRAEKRELQIRKQQIIESAHSLAQEQEDYVQRMTSFHKSCSERIDWERIKNAPEPLTPSKQNTHEISANDKFEKYTPNFFIKLFKLTEWRRKKLFQDIDKARQIDEENYQSELKSFQEEHYNWKLNQELSKRILEHDLTAYIEIISRLHPFKNVTLDRELSLSFSNGLLHIEIDVRSADVIPKSKITVLKSGKISEKSTPRTHFFSLYKDYVCSVTLRSAREMFALFPIEDVVINACDDLVKPETGHLEKQAILSVHIPSRTLSKLNFPTLDPSEAMKNFNHNMDFRNQSGFIPVQKVLVKVQENIA